MHFLRDGIKFVFECTTTLVIVKMKAIWITDVHFEFLDRTAILDFLQTIRQENPNVLLVGGDIGQASSIVSYLREMETRMECPIYFVLGNHDYYKGSIYSVRLAVNELVSTSRSLYWLNQAGVVCLSEDTALIGHDSWCDGRLGDFHGSSVVLNDFKLIEELVGVTSGKLLDVLNKLGDEAAEYFKEILPQALQKHHHIIVLTHVPPFTEAAWYNGRYCDDEWLPFFACQAVGDVLKKTMMQNPDRTMTVLCGHTHSSGESEILPNLHVFTGGANYGKPRIQRTLEYT